VTVTDKRGAPQPTEPTGPTQANSLRRMSGYTKFCTRAASAGWAAVPTVAFSASKWYSTEREKRKKRGVVSKAGNGCASWILLGPFVMTFLLLLIPVAICSIVVLYASAWTLLSAVGIGIDRARFGITDRRQPLDRSPGVHTMIDQDSPVDSSAAGPPSEASPTDSPQLQVGLSRARGLPPAESGQPWYRRKWWTIAILVFIFPWGLYLMWTNRPGWGMTTKVVISVILAAIWIPACVAAAVAPPQKTTASELTPQLSASSPQVSPTPSLLTRSVSPTKAPTPDPTATSAVVSQYSGMNLATAISTVQAAGQTPYQVGGGTAGVIVASDWTVCFSKTVGNSVTFYVAKNCAPDANSKTGSTPSSAVVSPLVGQNLQTAETDLEAAGYGYDEVGGGDLGIIVPSDWTVCYALSAPAAADLFAAKDCTAEPADNG
jgi:hypothetical protein